MELPPALRQAVDEALVGVPLKALARASEELSRRYRGEVRDGRLHLSDDLFARAYLATRLPATYAAVRAAFEAAAEVQPDFSPLTLLDAGAGPGSALWAAGDCWPSLKEALLIEGSAPMRALGERFSTYAPAEKVAWRTGDLAGDALLALSPHDLVTLAYVLDELSPERRAPLLARLWELTAGTLVIVEPGTPAGYNRILAAREQLLMAGAHLLAPCPHRQACPLIAPDWCHFMRRVARSRLHRQAKGGEVPWEDEKFIYLAAARRSGRAPRARVLAPARVGRGRVTLKLCQPDGVAVSRLCTRRDGALYKAARRVGWGDVLE
jgi:ribosomal protein RSM22 (predicted rRNA methylase)